jgi:hypothetical protein
MGNVIMRSFIILTFRQFLLSWKKKNDDRSHLIVEKCIKHLRDNLGNTYVDGRIILKCIEDLKNQDIRVWTRLR